MTQPKKLIEVAMPIKEVSAESVRDISIRQGHISTLHLWWARRPLPVCRAMIFASLVPDPLDQNCPEIFREAVQEILGKDNNTGDPYKPYNDIPYTSSNDKMDDNLRNRLLMFIGKFSDYYSRNEKSHKKTPPAKIIDSNSLIKWENRDNEIILGKARKLIWVAHNCMHPKNKTSLKTLLKDFEKHFNAIKNAEGALYGAIDRHIHNYQNKILSDNLNEAIESFLSKMPKVFDPFAGGGAIPLEAARLGCRSFGNDINPVAHIIQKAGLEFPQRYGKPIIFRKSEFERLYGEAEWLKLNKKDLVYDEGEAIATKILNRLSFDVGFYSKKLIALTREKFNFLYPQKENGFVPIVYYWARLGNCSNPS